MSDENQYVECCEHGKQQATFVCQHTVQSLVDGKPRGFWSSKESIENSRPDSWCSECEEVVNRTGEWDDESEKFAGVKLVCGACYDRVKLMNNKTNKKWWQVWS